MGEEANAAATTIRGSLRDPRPGRDLTDDLPDVSGTHMIACGD